MTDFYTEQLSGTYDTLEASQYIAPRAAGDLERRIRPAPVTFPISAEGVVEAGDKLIVARMYSHDRIDGLLLSADGNIPATSTVKIGVQAANDDNSIGADIIDDLFQSSTALSGVIARVDQFTGNGLLDHDRGKTLWELVNVDTPATYTEDPQESWFVVMEFIGDPGAIVAASELRFEIETSELG